MADIELQRDTLGRGRVQLSTIQNEHEAAGYGDTSTKIWKLYGAESERRDKELVDSWKSNTDSMLIFTGLFSTIVASFLIETYKTLTPASNSGSQSITSSAVRVNIIMFLSLFFSVTSALFSTLIQQWAREYLQYSQPTAAPHKRGRVRAYLFDGLSRFQMRRFTYGVPVLLHLAVFLFFYALSEWLYSINVPVGATARYCLVALLVVYIALSVLPLVVRNAPYHTALTTPLQACVSLIRVSYILLRRLVRRSSTIYQTHRRFGLFKSIHVDRARALMREIQRRSSELDRSAMHWLMQELDEDDMDTFLSGLPGYLHSPLTDKKLVVEGLMEDGVSGRIREHITACLRSVELSQEESMSRASTCINSLRLISETASETAIRRPGSESNDIQEIMEYLEPLCYNSSTALRASCIRGLVIREFLIPLVDLNARNVQTEFPDYLIPLHKVISVWKTTEIAQWSHITGILTTTSHPLPSDSEQVQQHIQADVYDGPLINLAVLAHAVLSRADEGDVNFDMAWKTFEILLKSLGLAQVRASPLARARFEEVLHKAHDGVSGYDVGVTQKSPLLEALDIVVRGLRLAEAFSHTPNPTLPRKQIGAIFGPDQLRNTELFEAFAAHLPGFVNASTPEALKNFMERLIREDKLWEQLDVNVLKCLDRRVPFSDKLRIYQASMNIFDVAFEVLKESFVIDWRSREFGILTRRLWNFEANVLPGNFISSVTVIRSSLFRCQLSHALLAQFSMQRSQGVPLLIRDMPSLKSLVSRLGIGTEAFMDTLTIGKDGNRTGLDTVHRSDAILTVTLRDGPLSNFCIMGRLIFDQMASEVSNLTSEDTTKMWRTLNRILDTPHLPLIHAAAKIWAKFDRLGAVVRDPVLLRGGSQTVENLRPLLDMIEKIERMRPPTDARAAGTGNVGNRARPGGSAGLETRRFGGSPIAGSSRQVEASHIERGATYFSPFYGTVPSAEASHSPSDVDFVTIDDPTSSTPTTQPSGSVEPDTLQLGAALIPGSSRQVEASLPGVGGPIVDTWLAPSVQASVHMAGMDPSAPHSPSDLDPIVPDAPPTSSIQTTQSLHVPQMRPLSFTSTHMPSLSSHGARRAFSPGPANLSVQAHAQSVPTDIPLPPRHMRAHPSPSSSGSGPLDVTQLGHVNQGGRVQTPDTNSRASTSIVLAELTYLFTAMLSKPVPTLTAIAVNI